MDTTQAVEQDVLDMSGDPRTPSHLGTTQRILVGSLILLLTILAYAHRFVQDDAFISFQYARNLVEFGQLDWDVTIPQRVEGHTNFLWVLLIALAMKLGFEPVTASWVLGLLSFSGSLIVTYQLARWHLHDQRSALIAVLLLGTNFSFSAYATGGLETSLQALLCVTGVLITTRLLSTPGSRADRILLSVTCIFAVLNRLDALLPFAIMYGFVLWNAWRASSERVDRIQATLELCTLPGLVFGGYALWKLSYYGGLLPNTYYVKAKGLDGEAVSNGVRFLKLFVKLYRLELATFILIVGCVLRPEKRMVHGLLIGILVSWLLYIVRVGGGFMEFRFLVPVLPIFFVLMAQGIALIRPRAIGLGIVVVIIASSFIHRNTFEHTRNLESIQSLQQHLDSRDGRWIEIGHHFDQLFGGADPPVVLATTAAGAIPYYSHLSTVDSHGLNDVETARRGHISHGKKIGHQRLARLDYLMERRVTLVLGHPRHVEADSVCSVRFDREMLDWSNTIRRADFDRIPKESSILEIPLDDGARLLALYLTPNSRVDALIRQEGWKQHELSRE